MILSQAEAHAVQQLATKHAFDEADVDELVHEVAGMFGLTVEKIRSAARRADVLDARTVIVVTLLSRGVGATTVGRAINRHHSCTYFYRDRARGMNALRELARTI